MKNILLFLSISFLFSFSTTIFGQDVLFSQYENTPHHINPALTGNFDGKARILMNYRNQWSSILGDNAYKTGMFSIDSKFDIGNSSTIGVGFYSLFDRAGQQSFGTNEYNLVSSITKNLGDPKSAHHAIALGINIGLASRQIDLNGSNEPLFNSKVNYFNFSTGLLWKYHASKRISFQLGYAIYHLNNPNISFFESGEDFLSNRNNLHGKIEFPIAKRFSLLPSFLYASQGNADYLIFGLANKWFFNAENTLNFAQIGAYLKSAKGLSGNRSFNTYALAAKIQYKSFLVSFSYDRYRDVESNAYEFTLGYTL